MVRREDCGKVAVYMGPGGLAAGLAAVVPAKAFDVNESAKNFLLALNLFFSDVEETLSMYLGCDSCLMQEKNGCDKDEDLQGIIACMLEKGRFMVVDTVENLNKKNKK